MAPPLITEMPVETRQEAIRKVFELIEKEGAQMVDIRFVDFLGQQQHFSIPADQFEPDHFDEGVGFDGSSIRGWKSIHESDMLVIPDPTTAFIDPFFQHKTVVLIGEIHEPGTLEPFQRCPRGIARRAEQFLKQSGIATWPTSGRKPSSSSSTMPRSTKAPTMPSTRSTRMKRLEPGAA
nr:glutamine synthetase beta-grasp domain-containing protein [Rhodothermus marinus]